MEAKRAGRTLWLLGVLALSLLCAALRRWQLATAFEGELNLPIPMAPASVALGCVLVMAAAVFGILAAGQRMTPPLREEERRRRWERALAAPGGLLGLGAVILAAFLMLLAAPLLWRSAWEIWHGARSGAEGSGLNAVLTAATGLSALVGFVGLMLVAGTSYRGRAQGKASILLPAVTGCLWLLELYRNHASDPVLWDYAPTLLAVMAGMLMYVDCGGLTLGRPRPRRILWMAAMTAVLSAVALAGAWQWWEALLLAAQLVMSLVVLSRLSLHLEHPTWASRVSIPEPDRGELWQQAEEENAQTGQAPAQEIQEEETHE